MTDQQQGEYLIKKYKSVSDLARQDAINQMCVGEYATDFYRALANVKLDLMQGKITQERYDELTRGLV